MILSLLLAVLGPTTTTRIPLPHGFRPDALASADFNGDGRADIAVAGLARGEVIVLLADARGGFRAQPPVAAGANPSNIDATNSLIAVANHEKDFVTLLSGDGRGHFTPRTLRLHSVPHPHAVAIGDFDRDGKPDLAVDSWGETRIELLFGRDAWRGPGTPVNLGTKPYWTISAADLDGDGNPDLITPNFGSGTVSILLGNGRGQFAHAPGSPFRAGAESFSAVVADLNGDHRPDVVIANYSGHDSDTSRDGLTWIRNDGARRFTPFPQRIANGDYSARLAAGDLNGDGIADAAFSNSNGSTVTVVFGSRSGPHETASVPVMPHPHAVTIAGNTLVVASEDDDELWLVRRR